MDSILKGVRGRSGHNGWFDLCTAKPLLMFRLWSDLSTSGPQEVFLVYLSSLQILRQLKNHLTTFVTFKLSSTAARAAVALSVHLDWILVLDTLVMEVVWVGFI